MIRVKPRRTGLILDSLDQAHVVRAVVASARRADAVEVVHLERF